MISAVFLTAVFYRLNELTNVRYGREQILAISDTPQNTDLSHIPFSLLPVEFESHYLWGLHPRNESRVAHS